MKVKITYLALPTLAVMAAACGASPDLSTPSGVADAIGCSGYHQAKPKPPMVKDAGSCKLDGEKIAVATLASADDASSYAQFAHTATGIAGSGAVVKHGKVVVITQTKKAASKVRSKLS